MKLTPGYYKIRKKGRNFQSNCHFLRVIIHTDQKGSSKKYFQIDHGLPEHISSDDENHRIRDMDIIKRYDSRKPVEYKTPRISVSFEDEDGDQFEMASRTLPSFERIMEQFPRLKNVLK